MPVLQIVPLPTQTSDLGMPMVFLALYLSVYFFFAIIRVGELCYRVSVTSKKCLGLFFHTHVCCGNSFCILFWYFGKIPVVTTLRLGITKFFNCVLKSFLMT